MNIQTARLWLADTIKQLDSQWSPTTRTWPELTATMTAEIGHAPPSPSTFRSHRVELPVIWWVNEGNEAAAVGRMYESLSFAPGSLAARLVDLEQVKAFTVDDVGAEQFRDGLTGFLRAVSAITLDLALIPEPDTDEEEFS